jgi:N6-L-threonylcarbamoyladenine synthase
MNSPIHILAIESSCDETSAAIISDGRVKSNHIATQAMHERFGGVVPEMASRAHMQNIAPVVHAALTDAGVSRHELSAVAFTQAPGLIGSLMVGVCFAKGFAQALGLPLISVHHMQAHVLAHFIDEKPEFPFMCLTVSGGHTQIVLCRDFLNMEVIGTTIDDAAGEAFDKVAKMLGLPYPGGPRVDKNAQQGDPHRFKFPMSEMKDYQFSFSGIKTSVLYFLRDETKKDPSFVENNMNDICASVQHTIIKMLMTKFTKAAHALGVRHVGIAGGVSANSGLRNALREAGDKHGWKVYIPKFEYCTDNAAMIGITAHYKYLKGEFCGLDAVPSARAAW